MVFQFFGKLQDLVDMFGVNINGIFRHKRHLGAGHSDLFLIQTVLDRSEVFRRGDDFEEIVLLADILGSRLQNNPHQPLFVHL